MRFDQLSTRPRRPRVAFLVPILLLTFLPMVSGTKRTPEPWKLPKLSLPARLFPSTPPPPPEPTALQRVATSARLPATALMQLVLASEATARASQKLNQTPTNILFWANLAVHLVWITARENRDLHKFLHRHFVLHPNDLTEGRIHALLLSAFSHESSSHLLSNLTSLLAVGPKLARALGTRRFSYFYMAAIYASDLFDQIIYSKFHAKNVKVLVWTIPVGSLGASGAIAALLTLSCLRRPNDRVNLSEMLNLDVSGVTLPNWCLLLFNVMGDLFPSGKSNIGHGAHLGGHIFGALVFVGSRLWKRLVRWRRKHKKSGMKKWARRNLSRKKKKGILSQLRYWGEQVRSGLSKSVRHMGKVIREAILALLDELLRQIEFVQELMAQRRKDESSTTEEDSSEDTGSPVRIDAWKMKGTTGRTDLREELDEETLTDEDKNVSFDNSVEAGVIHGEEKMVQTEQDEEPEGQSVANDGKDEHFRWLESSNDSEDDEHDSDDLGDSHDASFYHFPDSHLGDGNRTKAADIADPTIEPSLDP